MKQFGKIFKFEINNYLKNKIFVGVTIFLVAVIAAVMFFPRISELFSDSKQDESSNDAPVMLVAGVEGEYAKSVEESFAEEFSDYRVELSDGEMGQMKDLISAGDADCAFFIENMTSFTYYVSNLSLTDVNCEIAAELLKNIYQTSSMITYGIPQKDALEIMATDVDFKIENLGKDQMHNFFYTYIMIFALYLVILLYGQMVATSVATEKSSRAMELLITSAKPTELMFGKVISACAAGLIQLICIFGSALLFYRINRDYWDNEIVSSIFGMPTDLFVYLLVFFVLGFLVYAFMYGAIGSTASKLEDINTSVMPVTLLFVISFLVVMMSLVNGSLDSTLMRVCSFIPFTSTIAMFARIAMSSVPTYEIFISIAILIASVIGIGVIAAKIYRVGVLLYGTTPKIGEIIKALKNDN